MTLASWPPSEPIETSRLVLEPLRVEHAEEMAPVLDDQSLHAYTGGRPATLEQLRNRYARQALGHSPDGTHGWFNWVVRVRATGSAVGYVQASSHADGDRISSQIAWVIAQPEQGRGYAGEAAAAMGGWLRSHGTAVLVAHIHPDHRASIRVAERIGLTPTDVVVDGETRWVTARAHPRG